MAGRGSAPGERRGGRQKGTPNKVTVKRAAAIAESGKTPLDFMLSVLRDENASIKERMWAAVAAAPYVHAKPRPVAANVNAAGVQVQVVRFTHEQRLVELDALAQFEEDPAPPAQPVDHVQPKEDVLDRMEANWFIMDNRRGVREPALPPQIPPPQTLPQPPAPAVVAAPVPYEIGHLDDHPGNGHPRRVNGTDARHRPQTPPGERPRPRSWRDYPATHPVHGIV